MSAKQQTAVEWLEKRYYFTNGQLIDVDFEQAKEMEKQQNQDAYQEGGRDAQINYTHD